MNGTYKRVEKYIIRRVRIYHKDGTRVNIKTTKEVFNINSYREYLMAQYDATRVEFIYDTIPVERQGEIKLTVSAKVES